MFLPPRMRVMHITTRERFGGWLAEALTEVGGMDVEIDEAVGSAAGLAGLREENYDVVLVSHLPGELDALELIAGYRTGGTQLPMLVLGTESDQEMVAPCFEAGADGYLCVHTATTRNLLWAVARGVERHRLLQENHRLLSAEQSRLRREHDEADRLLTHQRALVGGLELLRHAAQENGSFFPGSASTASEEMTDGDSPIFSANKSEESPAWLPGELLCHYRELLRTYVIMGSGNLSDDLHRLAELLISAGLSARRTLQLHLQTLEELVRGLGARSTRHVMTRADLLILEVVVHLAEGYRQRYEERIHPPQQLRLPGL
ncbi:MAG: response regulator [Pirellulales bacterium]|nr:response regulator [Pirellulales bacterium]